MESARVYSLLIMMFAFASCIRANIAEFDEVWEKRSKEAWNRTLASYEPNPAKIVNHLNLHVHRALKAITKGSNSTRRHLGRRYNGPCMTNPIDRCWRCKPNWSDNRFRLADCGLGFGYKSKGGKNGAFYLVTDSSDNDMVNPKVGTLRHAVIQKEPLWIIFAENMVIRLEQELIMESDKTIDGRGANVHIAHGAGITIQYIKNVIIHGIRIHDIVPRSGGMIRDSVDHFGFRTTSDGDGISIFGSQDVWVDHVSMTNCADGLVDATMGSTGVTISNSHFTDHNKAMLFGANDAHSADAMMQVTLAFNHFGKRMVQRMPRCRWGYIHVVNNDYTHRNMYAMGGSSHPTIISQGNRYHAPPDLPFAKERRYDWDETMFSTTAIYSAFVSAIRRRYSSRTSEWRHLWEAKKTKPACVPDEYWAAWQTEWDKTEFKTKSATYRANRLSEPEGTGTGISKHIGGSRSTIDHAIDISKKTGREATKYEIFNRLHQKSDGAFTTQKAAKTAAEIESALDEIRTSTQSEPDVDQVYATVVQQKKNKYFGTGCFGRATQKAGCSSSLQTTREQLREEIRQEMERSNSATQEAMRERLRAEIRDELEEKMNVKLAEFMSRFPQPPPPPS